MTEAAPAKSRAVKCPVVLQMESVECGAAALTMILAYHRLFRPLPEVREACGVCRDGSKAVNLLRAARRYGFEAKGYKKEIQEVFTLEPPFVVFWNFNHFLVVRGWDAKGVWLNDPAQGSRKVSHAEFDDGYTGVVLTFKPGSEFVPDGKPASFWPSVRERLAASTSTLIYTLVAGSFLVLPNLAVPVFTQIFVDEVLVKGFSDWLIPLVGGMALAAMLTAGLRTLQQLALARLQIKLAIAMTSHFLYQTLRLPVSFYAQRFAGEIAGRLWLNDKVAGQLAGPLASTALDVVMLVIYAAVMFAVDPVLTLIGIVLALVNFALLRQVNGTLRESQQKMSQDYGKAQGISIGGLQCIETLKASGLESDFFSRWAGAYAKAVNTRMGMTMTMQLVGAMPVMLSALTSMAVLVIGGFRVLEGELSIGMLIGFQSLMGFFMAPVGRLLGLGASLVELEGDLNRLDDVLANAPAPEEAVATVPEAAASLRGHVALKGVSFGYSRLDAPLIDNFSLSLKPGQRVALVGGSGSGKSTIAKLIAGLYEPWEGEILFDGVPRDRVPRAALSDGLAVVDQDLFLFSGSVRDNLTLWDPTVSEQDLVKALADADVLQVVAGLPGGLDGNLAEGASNLSGGQRQRLEIARALTRNPAVLLLDEATSALDTESERVVDRNLRARGCTCVIVAHRLSTIRDCDEIIVLDRGKVVQRGTHESLKAEGGYYGRLLQAEGGALQEA